MLCAVLPAAANPAPSSTLAAVDSATSPGELAEVMVTAERLRLIGMAATASEGVVVNDELALLPAYRPGQLLETVPGLDVTSHWSSSTVCRSMNRPTRTGRVTRM
jgi:hypothetical protein